jgi:D-sedoheptulose 7-phosphate isomerase
MAVIGDYFAALAHAGAATCVTRADGSEVDIDGFLDWAVATARRTHAAGSKLMFIGNGGSSTIASHMAEDYSKCGGIRALAFNDPGFLTCLGNDLGYEHVFSKQLEWFAAEGDLLFAISSSGRSPNILNGVAAARERGCQIVTLSGFAADNPLRRLGDYNVYVPATSYGFVEIAHSAICHCILDTATAVFPQSAAA